MEQDIFYNADKLSHKEMEALLRKAHSICKKWWLDKLDCSESWARQRVKGATFEAAMFHFVDDVFRFVINRKPVLKINTRHLVVGFRSMESIDYFL
jgi:hypothetical protein